MGCAVKIEFALFEDRDQTLYFKLKEGLKENNKYDTLKDKNKTNITQKVYFLKKFVIHKRSDSKTKYAKRIEKAENDAQTIATINRIMNNPNIQNAINQANGSDG